LRPQSERETPTEVGRCLRANSYPFTLSILQGETPTEVGRCLREVANSSSQLSAVREKPPPKWGGVCEDSWPAVTSATTEKPPPEWAVFLQAEKPPPRWGGVCVLILGL
jgi:hypothetical protein